MTSASSRKPIIIIYCENYSHESLQKKINNRKEEKPHIFLIIINLKNVFPNQYTKGLNQLT